MMDKRKKGKPGDHVDMMEKQRPANQNDESPEDEMERDSVDIDVTNIENLVIPPPPEPTMNIDGSGSRLLITHIVNDNFKSYAGRHVIGPFHKNFTSIVGPNGSGKSNVIDSLLFVFGYRAQKIRSKKISVLIHVSEHHQNLQSCTVEIHFVKATDKGVDDFEIVPGSEFYISRTAHKHGASEYHLNGKKSHFKDIGIVLRKCGIDLDHNRFLILQGEVEQIALMKPKAAQQGDEGMLEYLEDIVGSSRLVPFIETLNKKCEELNEVRSDKAKRVKVVEQEKLALEETKNDAVEYLLLENEITKRKNLQFHFHMLMADDHFKQTSAQLEKIKMEFSEHELKMKDTKTKIDSKRKEYEEAKRKFDEYTKAAEEFQVLFQKMEKENTKAREDHKHCKTKLKKLKTSVEAERLKLEELKSQPEKAESLVKELNRKIEKLEKEKKTFEKQIEEGTVKLRRNTADLQAKKESAEKELAKVKKDVNEARSKVDIAKNELDMCVGGQKRENDKLHELNARLQTLVEGTSTKTELLEKSRNDLKQIDQKFQENQRELAKVTTEENDLVSKIRADGAKVSETRSAQQAMQGRGAVLTALLEEKRKGTIKGIIGRLGDLGAIDEKYDVAISTACGPLDNIVVDTIDTAQACVNFLKKRNIGQATFIALDKMGRFANSMHQQIQTPENVPRLFDLIRVEDKSVLPAFHFALKDTLVSPTLDQATRIALQGRTRWRVVTLQGHLLDPSGTMSGGGSRQMKGRMGRSITASASGDFSADQLKKLEIHVGQCNERLSVLRKKRDELEKLLIDDGAKSKRLKEIVEKCTGELTISKEEEPTLKKQISNQEKIVKKTTVDESEKKRLEKKVEEFEKDFKKINDSAEKFRLKVDEFHKQIMEISQKLVGSAQKLLDECLKELDECRKNITKANVSIKSAERNYLKTEEQVAKFEVEMQETEENIKKLVAKITELESDGIKLFNTWEKSKKSASDAEIVCVEIKRHLDSFEEVEQQLSAYAIDKRSNIEQIGNTMKDQKAQVSHWKREIDKLKLNDLRDLKPLTATEPSGSPKPTAKREPTSDEENDDSDVTMTSPRQSGDDEDVEVGGRSSSTDGGKGRRRFSAVDPRFDEFELPTPDEATIRQTREKDLMHKLTVDQLRLKAMKPNLAAIAEYRKQLEKYKCSVKELQDMTSLRDRVRAKHEELRKLRLNEFLTGFRAIATRLKEMYQMITLGGDADLDLVDTMDPFSEGIVFSVRPPKKSWKQISNLSGGEKTLSSLALVFALHHYKPTPLYVMDEIDAALDFRNVSIVANYIKDRTKNAQFIVISLRNNMFELSDRLVGIYKTYNCTKSVTIDPRKLSAGHPLADGGAKAGRNSAVEVENRPVNVESRPNEPEPAALRDSGDTSPVKRARTTPLSQ